LVQQLIHGLKYKGYQNIGFALGNWLGAELKTVQAYKNIDLVIPVPLHKSKLKKRGIENKHILIVDDVITTGATLEACINVLQQANNVKISIATIAIA